MGNPRVTVTLRTSATRRNGREIQGDIGEIQGDIGEIQRDIGEI